ncbi:lipid kinase [Pseudomonas luteola]|uniref:Lipid kinase n=1 Tax=Pseudomonas luteola TaxID=47886 RepID=A0ABS0MTH0_PSELU|nr:MULTISPECIES: lipid kinase [Pseudomonas]MBH3440018.1 lipid kinase [Pseudomonas luteola]RRW43706.1 lipid kinase [Pseudomonas luteola]
MTATETRRALLLINKRARRGSESYTPIVEKLSQGGIAIIEPTGGENLSISEKIRQAKGCDLIIVGGGDGTLNAAAPALIEAGLPVGLLPLGTANDLAKTLNIPQDPLEAVDIIVRGQLRAIDVGVVNDHVFLNVASIGFSADLADQLTADIKKKWGSLGYGLTAFRLLRRFRRFTLYIEHDGQVEKVRTVQASVGNGRHYGGGMTVEESATADDGRLDFYSLEVRHWWELIALLPSLRKGTHGKADKVRAFQTTAIRLNTHKPMPINTDGELTTYTPALFSIKPKALRIYRP